LIYIYERDETTFSGNGIGTLMPYFAIVKEEINGAFELYLEHNYDDTEKYKRIQKGRIIKCKCHKNDDQLFRVYYVETELPGIIVCNARHIYYDLLDNFIEDTRPTLVNAQAAGTAILNGCQFPSGFSFVSDIAINTSAYYVRVNPVVAMIGSIPQSVVNRWGGEIDRNNKVITLKERMGSVTGIKIKYKKNLKGLVMTEDESSVFTRLMPIALNENDTVLKLPEKYVDSEHIAIYHQPKIIVLDCKDIKVGQEYDDVVPYPTVEDAYTEMRNRCQLAFDNGIDLPILSLSVDFIDWQNIKGYEEYAALFDLELGDTISVIHARLGIEKSLRVVEVEYNVLKSRFEKMIAGENLPNLSRAITEIDTQITNMIETNENALYRGEKYNAVSINHDEGFVCVTDRDGTAVKVRMNAISGFEVLNDNVPVAGINDEGNFYAKNASIEGDVLAGSGNNIGAIGVNGIWRMWAGHAAPADAPFRVAQDGTVYAKDLQASGTGTGSTGIGVNVESTGNNSVAVGKTAKASAVDALALGTNSEASGSYSTAVGSSAKATQLNASAYGNASQASSTDATAIGHASLASGVTSSAIGALASAIGQLAVAIGKSANASGVFSTAIGGFAKASAADATAIGKDSEAIHSNSSAIGVGAKTTANNNVVLGNSWVTHVRSAGTYTSLSDIRDKADIADCEHGLDIIKKIKPIKYKLNPRERYIEKSHIKDSRGKDKVSIQKFKEDGTRKDNNYQYGFSAQDLLEIQKGTDLHVVDESDPNQLGVAALQLIPLLVKSIQELNKEIDELKKLVNSREAKK